MRHVIIGSSTAGTAAAETLRRVDPGGEIVLISEDETPYSRSLTPYFISGHIDEGRLRFKPRTFYADLDLEAKRGRAVAIDSSSAQVVLAGGEKVAYDELLIAAGASPVIPPIAGSQARGVFTLRTVDDAKAIAQAAECGSRAVVIGGGLVGLLAAKALRELGQSVVVVEALPHLLPQQLDPAAAQIVAETLMEHGIRLVLGQHVNEIASGSGQVGGVVLSTGEPIDADLVIIGVGVRPNVSLATASGIATGRGILVDPHMQTSIPHVYAAGDVAEVADLLTGEKIVSGTWIAATEQGKVAAYNMAGQRREYEGALAVQNAVDLFGLPVVSVGLVNPPDDSYETLLVRQPARRLYKKLVLKDDVVKGMIGVGDIARAGVITALIRGKTPVTEFKDELLAGNFTRAPFGAQLAASQSGLDVYV